MAFPIPADFLSQSTISSPAHASLFSRLVNGALPLPLSYDVVQEISAFADSIASDVPPLSNAALQLKHRALSVHLAAQEAKSAQSETGPKFVANLALGARGRALDSGFSVGGLAVPLPLDVEPEEPPTKTQRHHNSGSAVPPRSQGTPLSSVSRVRGRLTDIYSSPSRPSPRSPPPRPPSPSTSPVHLPPRPFSALPRTRTPAPGSSQALRSAVSPSVTSRTSDGSLGPIGANFAVLATQLNNATGLLNVVIKSQEASNSAVHSILADLRSTCDVVRSLDERLARIERAIEFADALVLDGGRQSGDRVVQVMPAFSNKRKWEEEGDRGMDQWNGGSDDDDVEGEPREPVYSVRSSPRGNGRVPNSSNVNNNSDGPTGGRRFPNGHGFDETQPHDHTNPSASSSSPTANSQPPQGNQDYRGSSAVMVDEDLPPSSTRLPNHYGHHVPSVAHTFQPETPTPALISQHYSHSGATSPTSTYHSPPRPTYPYGIVQPRFTATFNGHHVPSRPNTGHAPQRAFWQQHAGSTPLPSASLGPAQPITVDEYDTDSRSFGSPSDAPTPSPKRRRTDSA